MEKKANVLLAEDDVNLGSLLKEYLAAKGYNVDLCPDGEEGSEAFQKNQYDICILDVMMPKKDGFTLATEIREINSDIPLIFLTAKRMKGDIFKGFDIGADDYMTKPFNMQELLMRIEAILRRAQSAGASKSKDATFFKFGKFSFDAHKQTLVSGDKSIHLTTKESELLGLLCNNMNSVLEREEALKKIWLDDNYFNARSMDVYITKLRKHLRPDPAVEIINVHGKGFKLIVNSMKAN